jgi:hypothetical protein
MRGEVSNPTMFVFARLNQWISVGRRPGAQRALGIRAGRV